MSYLIGTLATLLVVILLVLGYWKYTIASLVLFAIIGSPFIWKARAMATGKNKVRLVLGSVLLLIIFIIIVFVAALVINFGFWYLFKQH